MLAEVHARTDESERALAIVERALAEAGDAVGRSWEAELHRQRALILLALDPSRTGEVEVHLQKSLEVAHEQGARSLELRAATSLAELWQTQGRREDARALLEPIYRWFQEGFETADLKQARYVQSTLH